MRRLLLLALPVLPALVLAACSGPGAQETAVQQATPEARTTPSAAPADDGAPPPFPWERVAEGEAVPGAETLERIRPGGPPPDGIPPIDDPTFETVEAAGEWLSDRDPVMVVQVDDDVRVYPLAILTWHEIVNDTVAGTPVVVTYCPLCNSALAFTRTLDGEVLDFGTSGRLLHSNLVMYDRQGRNLWSQFTGEVLVGDRLGARLDRVPAQLVAWSDVRASVPDAHVLSRDTGVERPYGSNPYAGYDSSGDPFLFDGDTDDRLPQMARVTVVRGDPSVAIPLEVLARERVVTTQVDGEDVVALWSPGAASALDTADIDLGADVGATGVFRAVHDGAPLDLEPADGNRFVDPARGTTVDVLGAVDGGGQLRRVPHEDTFWFVQFAFEPETQVLELPDGAQD